MRWKEGRKRTTCRRQQYESEAEERGTRKAYTRRSEYFTVASKDPVRYLPVAGFESTTRKGVNIQDPHDSTSQKQRTSNFVCGISGTTSPPSPSPEYTELPLPSLFLPPSLLRPSPSPLPLPDTFDLAGFLGGTIGAAAGVKGGVVLLYPANSGSKLPELKCRCPPELEL